MDIKTILFYVAIAITLYVVYLLVFASSDDLTLTGISNAKGSNTISSSNLKPGNSNDYTFSIWAYVNDWNYRFGQSKTIFQRVDKSNSPAPSMALAESSNDLIVTISYKTGSTTNQFACKVENIPLQRWTNYIMVVNGRSLDIYVDGKLVKTCVIPGVPSLDDSSTLTITPNGGFSGFTSALRYINYAINPSEAYSIYKEGYGSSNPLGNYKMKFSLFQNSQEKYSYEL
jgi:hypothetical protein